VRFAEFTHRFIHQPKGHLAVTFVFGGELTPKAGKLGIGWTTLADDPAVPTRVVMDVDNAHLRTGAEASANSKKRVQSALEEGLTLGRDRCTGQNLRNPAYRPNRCSQGTAKPPVNGKRSGCRPLRSGSSGLCQSRLADRC